MSFEILETKSSSTIIRKILPDLSKETILEVVDTLDVRARLDCSADGEGRVVEAFRGDRG